MRVLLLISFCFFQKGFSQDNLKLLRLSDVVGDTIDAAENAEVKLFPFFSSKDFKYACFFIVGDRSIYLTAKLHDSLSTRKVSLKEFDWMKARVENNFAPYHAKYSPNKQKRDSIARSFYNKEIRWASYWGIGDIFSAKGSFLVGGEIQCKHQLFGFRMARTNERHSNNYSHVNDWALLYGISTKYKWFSASVSAGPALTEMIHIEVISFLYDSYTKTIYDYKRLGLAYQAKFMLIPARFFSLGIYGIGNICDHSFFQTGIIVQLGKQRSR